MSEETVYERMLSRYESQEVPWDHELPPPEVMTMIERLPSGRALDIGCGYGRASIYMAQHGWQVDAVDFVQQALQEARRRAHAAAVTVNFMRADISELHFLTASYDLVVDVGCSHSLTNEQLRSHHAELKRLICAGGIYLLYGRLQQPEEQWGFDEPFLLDLYQDGFDLIEATPGVTHMADGSSWSSEWFTFQRQAESA
ncbi:MAG: class I SAM-dependent methyltransferase [Anaerolineales bacterium]|nr:class I SAM-dependent methyltransferase [Anaerolineales bacterium]